MGQLRTICLTLIGVFLARYGYNHYEKTKRITVDESPLFAQRLEGTVKEYAARKRIEEVVPGVYAAIDYSLASRYCTKCQKETQIFVLYIFELIFLMVKEAYINPCGESGQLIVHLNFAKNG